MKKNKIYLIIFIMAIFLSLSAANATDINDDGMTINEDSTILLNENHFDDDSSLNQNIEEDIVGAQSLKEDQNENMEITSTNPNSQNENIEETSLNLNDQNEEIEETSLNLNDQNEEIGETNINSNDSNEGNTLSSNTKSIYVDTINGDDSNDGLSLENSLKTFGKALNISENDCTIHLADGNYSGLENTAININKSLTIIGNENTNFDGLGENYIFIIEDNLTINFRNVNFINGCKDSSITDSNNVYGGALEIKRSKVNMDNCKFINNILDSYNDEEYKFGGAISNLGDLTITNSYFYNNRIISNNRLSYGGAIYNKGNMTVNNSAFIESKGDKRTYGAGVYNDGNANMENSIIANSYSDEESKGSAIYNKGNFTLKNSIIENNTVERLKMNYIQGNVFNSGLLIAIGNIFRNNSGCYKQPNSEYEGSPNIYSVGDLDLRYNIFINNAPFNRISQDLFISGGRDINIGNNFWGTNSNPFNENKINLDIVNSWIVLDLSPEYSLLDIGHTLEIRASLKSCNNESLEIGLLPTQNISLIINNKSVGEQEIINGIATFNYSFSEKGTYDVSVRINNLTKTAIVDVGKNEAFIDLNISENINYTEDLEINFTVHDEGYNLLDGNVIILLNEDNYTVSLINGKGNLTISNLIPNDYTLKLIYEGTEDYSKAFNEKNFTINKSSVNLSLDIEDIDVGEVGNAIIRIDPTLIPAQIKLYINNEYKDLINLYNETTNLTLNDFVRGEYLITVEYVGTTYYESVNASALFKVNGLEGTISVSCEDIKIGNNATVVIESDKDDLNGNAILSINGQKYQIYLENKTTNITLINLTNGTYDIKVIYNGNNQYEPTNASCSFAVSKYSSNLIVDIVTNEESEGNESDTFAGNIIVKTEPNNCTGTVTLFINIRQYTLDLNEGTCNFTVEFDKGTNYIFVFYEGDYFHEDNSWNTTYGAEDEFSIISSNVSNYEHNDFNYTVLLVEKNGMTMPGRIVNVTFNGETHTIITDNEGKAHFPLNLEVGEYSINASYKNKTISNKITIYPLKFDLITYNITYGENKSIEVIFDLNDLSSNSEGNLTGDIINGKISFKILDLDKNIEIVNEEIAVKDNKAFYEMNQLNVGNYSVSAFYKNDAFNSSAETKLFNIKKADANLNIDCKDITFGETARISVSLPNASGNIQFNINETNFDVEFYNSTAILNLTDLDPGTYTVLINFIGDSNYNPSQTNTSFSVRNSTTDLNIFINNTQYGKDITVIAKLNDDAEGNVSFRVNDMMETIEIKDGTASWTFNGLEVGSYDIEAIYSGDHKYIPKTNSTSFEIHKANSFIEVYANDVCLDENIRIFANLSKNATGTVTFSIEGYYSPRDKNISNASAHWYISPLDAGTYTVLATYNGDKNYYSSSATYLLNVSKTRAILDVEISDRNVNDTITVNAKLKSANNENISGNITVTIGNKSYNMAIKNGMGSLDIGKFAIGNYSFNAKYEGSQKYSQASSNGEFKVIDSLLNAKLETKEFSEYYKSGKQLSVRLLDDDGNPISGETIYIVINQKSYKRITDSQGNAKLNINLKSGNYTAKILFNESKTYHALSKQVKVAVLKTVQANDLTKKYNTSGQYIAIFYNPNGKALGDAKVQLTIGKNTYNFTTYPNGIVRVNINLSPGKYTIKATNPVSGEVAKNTIFIFQNIMENKNVVKYFGGSEVYKVRAYGNNGKPVGAGQTVTFKLNGKTYSYKTDKNGYASIKINCKPKTYTITATYNKFKVSNKIVVKPVLTAKNVSAKKGKKIKFTAKLVNTKGKALKAKKITFKFRNKKYSAKTNSKGVSTIKIKIALKVGTYKIQSIYGKSKITNTVKIKK